MTGKKRGLGRGLDALLSPSISNVVKGSPKTLSIDLLQRGKYQPRTVFESEPLQELADSITAQGLIQPIVVRKISEDKYEILAGERRWRAAQLAGLQEVPIVIKDVEDQAAMAISLIENIQREDLNALDEAEALARLIEEFDMTHQQVGDAVGRSRVAVSNIVRLLDLSDATKGLLRESRLEMGHARALLALSQDKQFGAASNVVSKGLSVRATEAMVKQLLKEKPEPSEKDIKDPDIERLQQNISEKLGANVVIQHASSGKGKISISYSSLDELEGVLSHFQ